MVRKVGSEWVVYNHNGTRVLGRHKSKASALAQLRAIEAAKHRRSK